MMSVLRFLLDGAFIEASDADTAVALGVPGDVGKIDVGAGTIVAGGALLLVFSVLEALDVDTAVALGVPGALDVAMAVSLGVPGAVGKIDVGVGVGVIVEGGVILLVLLKLATTWNDGETENGGSVALKGSAYAAKR